MTEATTNNQAPSNQHTTLPPYPTREQLHRTFGGLISQSDFNMDMNYVDNSTRGSLIAKRIEDDRKRERRILSQEPGRDVTVWK